MTTPVWLSHHPPETRGERCVQVGGVHLCRRCLALWPLTYGGLALLFLGGAPVDHPLDHWLFLSLLPPVVEYVGVHRKWWDYRPWRVWFFSALLAPGLARLFHRHLHRPLDPENLAWLAVVAVPCAWAAWHHHRDPPSELPDLDQLHPELRNALLRAPRSPGTGPSTATGDNTPPASGAEPPRGEAEGREDPDYQDRSNQSPAEKES